MVAVIILVLTVSTLIASMPLANAQVINRPTHSYVTLGVNPVGEGQTENVVFMLVELNPLLGVDSSAVWRGFTVKITAPDNTTETLGPFNADPTGSSYTTFVPTQVGTYKVQAIFPGQWVNGSYTTVTNTGSWSNVTGQPLKSAQLYFAPSESPVETLTVQQKPIPSYPDNPLPTDYWTRPIYGENKGWSVITDNWLMRGYNTMNRPFQNGAAFAPITSGPESSHILWTKPLTFGGEAGGKYGDMVYYTGLSYEQFYEQLILNGRIYYQDHGPVSSADTFGTSVLDLYTGEQIMYLNGVKTDLAQVLDFEAPNEHGLLAFTWSMSGSTTNGTWTMFDAYSEKQILTITNITSGTEAAQSVSTVFGPNGELLSYSITGTGANLRMTLWNSTLAIEGYTNAYFSPRVGSVIDGRKGIQWNVSMPAMSLNPAIVAIGEDYILTQGYDKSGFPYIYQDAAFPMYLERNTDGTYPTSTRYSWIENRTTVYAGYFRTPRNIENGVYCEFDEALAQYHGYDLKTGKELWTTESLSSSGWSVFTYVHIQAYGNLYTVSYDGHIRAFSTTTGQKVWDYYMGPAGSETLYGHWPSRAGFTVADGKIYASNDEHTPNSVMWRGGKLYCLDAYTGEQYWNISGWLRDPAISDGILTAVNSYDNQIYTLGKGPSKLTVVAPSVSITTTTPITISGTITDVSPGAKQNVVAANFPNGLPCVSDESQSAFMEAVYQQKAMPTNMSGVPVTINVIDSNGNYRTIGSTTSNAYGAYSFTWTPDISGDYTVIATFAGTNSYYSSEASAAFHASDPATTPAPTDVSTIQSTVDLYFIPAVIAIIIAIVLSLAVTILVLRKRP